MIEVLSQMHEAAYLEMSRAFYQSAAVSHSIPEGFRRQTFREAVSGSPYVEGYFFSHQGRAAGFAILAKTFSQEAGGLVLWLEDFYIHQEFRGIGLGSTFLSMLKGRLGKDVVRIRLEIAPDNQGARRLYQRWGFLRMPYEQYVLELPSESRQP